MGTASVPPRALVVGPPTVLKTLQPLFARSYWMLENDPTLSDALRRLKEEPAPVIFCRIADCESITRAVTKLNRPPLVIALSDEDSRKGSWIETIAPNVHSVNVGGLTAARLFPVLNHAWRSINESI